AAGVRQGVVVSGAPPLERGLPWRGEVDLLLVMTVHPGFAGQACRADVVPKIQAAREHIDRERLSVELQGDGGIKLETAPVVARAGADILVSGSGIFPDHVAANLKKLREVAERAARDRP